MSNLKDQQKKLLRAKITGKVMEHLMGLNEKNEPAIRQLTKKSAQEYCEGILQGYKITTQESTKGNSKQQKEAEVLPIAEPVVLTEEPNLMSS